MGPLVAVVMTDRPYIDSPHHHGSVPKSGHCPKADSHLESVESGTNDELIAKVAKIWVRPDEPGMDVTWGLGRWHTDRLHRPELFTAHDLSTLDGVDFRHLPQADFGKSVTYFDTPYTDVGSRKSSVLGGMYDGYGLEPCRGSEATADLIATGVKECACFLAPSGILMVKCGNSISGGHRRFGLFVVERALAEAGLSVVDLITHHSRPSPQLEGRRVMHNLNVGSFLVVAQKPPLRHPFDSAKRKRH